MALIASRASSQAGPPRYLRAEGPLFLHHAFFFLWKKKKKGTLFLDDSSGGRTIYGRRIAARTVANDVDEWRQVGEKSLLLRRCRGLHVGCHNAIWDWDKCRAFVLCLTLFTLYSCAIPRCNHFWSSLNLFGMKNNGLNNTKRSSEPYCSQLYHAWTTLLQCDIEKLFVFNKLYMHSRSLLSVQQSESVNIPRKYI